MGKRVILGNLVVEALYLHHILPLSVGCLGKSSPLLARGAPLLYLTYRGDKITTITIYWFPVGALL